MAASVEVYPQCLSIITCKERTRTSVEKTKLSKELISMYSQERRREW